MTNKADGGSYEVYLNKQLYPDGSALKTMDDLLKAAKDQEVARLARERKKPRWKRFSEDYDRACRDMLMSDGWTLKEGAHLLAGYIPGRPAFGDQGSKNIASILKHLENSVGSSLYPSKKTFMGEMRGTDLFSSKSLIKWGLGKNLQIHEALEGQVRSVVVEPKKPATRKKRKDTLRIEVAVEMAEKYWNEELKAGKRRSQAEVARYLIRELPYLQEGDEVKIKGWIYKVCPWRDENKAIYKSEM